MFWITTVVEVDSKPYTLGFDEKERAYALDTPSSAALEKQILTQADFSLPSMLRKVLHSGAKNHCSLRGGLWQRRRKVVKRHDGVCYRRCLTSLKGSLPDLDFFFARRGLLFQFSLLDSLDDIIERGVEKTTIPFDHLLQSSVAVFTQPFRQQ